MTNYIDQQNIAIGASIGELSTWIKVVKNNLESKLLLVSLTPYETDILKYVRAFPINQQASQQASQQATLIDEVKKLLDNDVNDNDVNDDNVNDELLAMNEQIRLEQHILERKRAYMESVDMQLNTVIQPKDNAFGVKINNVEGDMKVDEVHRKAPTINALLRINNDQREKLYYNIYLEAKKNVLSLTTVDNPDFQNLINKEGDRLLQIYLETH